MFNTIKNKIAKVLKKGAKWLTPEKKEYFTRKPSALIVINTRWNETIDYRFASLKELFRYLNSYSKGSLLTQEGKPVATYHAFQKRIKRGQMGFINGSKENVIFHVVLK